MIKTTLKYENIDQHALSPEKQDDFIQSVYNTVHYCMFNQVRRKVLMGEELSANFYKNGAIQYYFHDRSEFDLDYVDEELTIQFTEMFEKHRRYIDSEYESDLEKFKNCDYRYFIDLYVCEPKNRVYNTKHPGSGGFLQSIVFTTLSGLDGMRSDSILKITESEFLKLVKFVRNSIIFENFNIYLNHGKFINEQLQNVIRGVLESMGYEYKMYIY